MEELVGVATRVNRGTTIHGTVVNGRGSISSQNVINFSVDRSPVEYRAKGSVALQEGDNVAVVGPRLKNGMVQAYAIRNLDDGLLMSLGSASARGFGIAFLVIGFATMAVGVGFVFMYFGQKSLKEASEIDAAEKIGLKAEKPAAFISLDRKSAG